MKLKHFPVRLVLCHTFPEISCMCRWVHWTWRNVTEHGLRKLERFLKWARAGDGRCCSSVKVGGLWLSAQASHEGIDFTILIGYLAPRSVCLLPHCSIYSGPWIHRNWLRIYHRYQAFMSCCLWSLLISLRIFHRLINSACFPTSQNFTAASDSQLLQIRP